MLVCILNHTLGIKIWSGNSFGFFKLCFSPYMKNNFLVVNVEVLLCKGEGTSRELATAMQQQFPRKIAYFKHATGFQIRRCTLRKLAFD
jgi:hypothetical protein